MVSLAKLNEPTKRPTNLERNIQDMEGSAQRTRLEAMRLAALILTKMNGALPATGGEVAYKEELAALQCRHASLIQKAEDLQIKIDRLRADEYDQAYRC